MRENALAVWSLAAACLTAFLGYASPGSACDTDIGLGATVPIDDTEGRWLGSQFEQTSAAAGDLWWTNNNWNPEVSFTPAPGNASTVQAPQLFYSDGWNSGFRVPLDAAPGDTWITDQGIELLVQPGPQSEGGEFPSLILVSQALKESVGPDNVCAIAAPLYRHLYLEAAFDFAEDDVFLYDLWLTSDLSATEPPETPPSGSLLSPETFPNPFGLSTNGSYLLIISPIHRHTGERQPPLTYLLELDQEKAVAGVYFSRSCGCSSDTELAPAAVLLAGLLFRRRRRPVSSNRE